MLPCFLHFLPFRLQFALRNLYIILLISYEFLKNRHRERHNLFIDLKNIVRIIYTYNTCNLDELPHRKCAKQCIQCCEFRKNRHSKSHTSRISILVKFVHPQLLTIYKFLPTFLRFQTFQYMLIFIFVPKHEGQFPLSHLGLMPLSFQILAFSDVIQHL
jgi:hypothetical protein